MRPNRETRDMSSLILLVKVLIGLSVIQLIASAVNCVINNLDFNEITSQFPDFARYNNLIMEMEGLPFDKIDFKSLIKELQGENK